MECIKCRTIYSINDYFIGCPKCFNVGEPSSLSLHYQNFIIDKSKVGLSRYSNMPPYSFKNEGQNPTGSHKDRLSPFVIARAKSIGRKTVAVASSGNAGASIAANAEVANLECVVLTTTSINPIWRQAIERWKQMKNEVENGEWYPATNFINPPVGCNAFGVQGFKTVAYEIIEDFEKIPITIELTT